MEIGFFEHIMRFGDAVCRKLGFNGSSSDSFIGSETNYLDFMRNIGQLQYTKVKYDPDCIPDYKVAGAKCSDNVTADLQTQVYL